MPDETKAHVIKAMRVLDFPMIIVTTFSGGERAGCLVGFSTQCSIKPPRFLFCSSELNHTFRVLQKADAAAVHILSSEQRELAELFGEKTGDELDKFAQCEWREGPLGVPVLDQCPNWFVGKIIQRHMVGDHQAIVLEPIEADSCEECKALMLFSSVRDMKPGHEP